MATDKRATVHVVEDEETVRRALAFLIESAGWRVRTYPSAQEFIERYKPSEPECLLLDVKLPGMSGLELQAILRKQHVTLPVIILTAYADVPTAVRAMRGGAFDVIEKPFNGQLLMDRVAKCLERNATIGQQEKGRIEALARLERLSTRERQVLDLLLAGSRSKEIAAKLGISVKTAERHRANIMRKLEASSLSDLLRIALLK